MKRILIALLLASGFAESGLAMEPNDDDNAMDARFAALMAESDALMELNARNEENERLARYNLNQERLVRNKLNNTNNAAMLYELNELLFKSVKENESVQIVKFAQGQYAGCESMSGTKDYLIESLLSEYADINDLKKAGWCVVGTPQHEYQHKQAILRPGLCWAFQSWDYVKAEQLLDEGADINTRVIGSSTPLMIAAVRKDEQLCKQLLKRNPDINAIDEEGRTALMSAADEEHCGEVCELIVKAILKPTKEHKDTVVALLGSRKKECLLNKWGVPRDIMQMIGKRIINEANKAKALAEINKIEDEGIKQRLVNRFINQ